MIVNIMMEKNIIKMNSAFTILETLLCLSIGYCYQVTASFGRWATKRFRSRTRYFRFRSWARWTQSILKWNDFIVELSIGTGEEQTVNNHTYESKSESLRSEWKWLMTSSLRRRSYHVIMLFDSSSKKACKDPPFIKNFCMSATVWCSYKK